MDPRYGKTPRDLLVWLTTLVQKDFPSDFFIKRFLATCPPGVNGVIIPDVRFEHDVNLVRRYGGVIVKVIRPDAPVAHDHESPIDALRGDIVLENNAHLGDFEKKVYSLATYLIK